MLSSDEFEELVGFTATPRASFRAGGETLTPRFPGDYVAVSRRLEPRVEVRDSETVFVYEVVSGSWSRENLQVGHRVAETDAIPDWKPGTEFEAVRDSALAAERGDGE